MSKRPLSLLNSALLSLVLLANTSIAAINAQSNTEQAPYLHVELTTVGKELQFSQAARLVDVLKQAQQQGLSLPYPLATTLFDHSESALSESTALKDSVLKQMAQHNLSTHPFYQYIQKQQFAPRLLSAIDLDEIRLDKLNNPLLHGDLALTSAPREEMVIYLGNVKKNHATKDQAGIPLKQQIINLKQYLGEQPHSPVLIYPNGNVVNPHDGSWLSTQYYLPPLTMVYIPFYEYETSKMDQDIVQLLTQLKPIELKKPQ